MEMKTALEGEGVPQKEAGEEVTESERLIFFILLALAGGRGNNSLMLCDIGLK
jgi:hypothetical protein